MVTRFVFVLLVIGMLGISTCEGAVFEWTLVFNLRPGPNGVAQGFANSSSITTTLQSDSAPEWFYSSISDTPQAYYSSIIVPQGDSYSESGNITFSTGNEVSFTSAGANGSFMGFSGKTQYGAVHYEITGGTGVFEGVQGAMTDIFTRTGLDIQLSLWAKCWN